MHAAIFGGNLADRLAGIASTVTRLPKFPTLVSIPNCKTKTTERVPPAIQGKDCLVQKFRNSSVMLEHPSFRPKVCKRFELVLRLSLTASRSSIPDRLTWPARRTSFLDPIILPRCAEVLRTPSMLVSGYQKSYSQGFNVDNICQGCSHLVQGSTFEMNNAVVGLSMTAAHVWRRSRIHMTTTSLITGVLSVIQGLCHPLVNFMTMGAPSFEITEGLPRIF